MVRYADDIVVFTPSKEEAKATHAFVGKLLDDIKLSIPGLDSESKTQILGPDDPIDFLGREIVRVGIEQRAVWRVSKKQIAKIVRRLEDEYTLEARLKDGSNFQDTIIDVRNSIAAYFSIYKGAHNFPTLDTELHGANRRIIRDIFFDLFGENAFTNITLEQQKFLGISRIDLDETDHEFIA
ncbi:hypothetical protein SSBR45G_37960 [Bradyrhizobium sp. SSBR45G]|nr:hypothetical protein SSBR45G_37960 [Bradyrhizobium sp. SSBR45G]GLH86399.1 hypothetical protein SSBR45R_38590 [Bradyrhizobium sp. SSBR45R]